jgi:hypothetical protein
MAASEKRINEILGSPDDMKCRSSMTLFDAVSKDRVPDDGQAMPGDPASDSGFEGNLNRLGAPSNRLS